MRRLVVGDIHGAYKALMDVLEKAEFNPKKDMLIGIGDYVDGYSQTFEVIEYLRTLPHFIGVRGNHDDFFLEWTDNSEKHPNYLWTSQGGIATLKSYNYQINEVHKKFLETLPYYIELDNKLFVHGGYNPQYAIDYQYGYDLTWNRNLIRSAVLKRPLDSIIYDKVFLGHTALKKVFISEKVIGIDTGAGWQEKLTIMDIDTLDYWQSLPTAELYPHEQGRN